MTFNMYVEGIADRLTTCLVPLPDHPAQWTVYDRSHSLADASYEAWVKTFKLSPDEAAAQVGRLVRWNPVTLALLGAAYVLGLGGSITEETEVEWWVRILLVQRTTGKGFALPFGGSEGVMLTRDDITRHRGFSTNVHPGMTSAQFGRAVLHMIADEIGEKLPERKRRR